MKTRIYLAYAAVCYLMFLAVYAYLGAFMVNIVVPKSIDSLPGHVRGLGGGDRHRPIALIWSATFDHGQAVVQTSLDEIGAGADRTEHLRAVFEFGRDPVDLAMAIDSAHRVERD